MKKVLAMMAIMSVMVLTVQPMAVRAAEYTESISLEANEVLEHSYISGKSYPLGDYITLQSDRVEAGEDLSINWFIMLPMDGLTASKLSKCNYANAKMAFTSKFNGTVNDAMFIGTNNANCTGSFNLVVTLYVLDEDKEILNGQQLASWTKENNRFVTWGWNASTLNYSMPKISANARYLMLWVNASCYDVASAGRMDMTVGTCDIDLEVVYDSETDVQFAIDEYNASVGTKVEQNQQTIIDQNNQIITPDSSDQQSSNQMKEDVANKGEQSNQLLEDSKVDKPDISDEALNPMDKVDEGALNMMGGVIGTVFASPTLGSIAVMTLVFALIGYILYGKR